MRRFLIAGNWKMFLDHDGAVKLAKEIVESMPKQPQVDVAIFPPAVFIEAVAKAVEGSPITVGAQNMHYETEGAFTGEISSKMVLTSGGRVVIIGHSERRNIFGESDEFIQRKVKRALDDNLVPVLCIGEKLEQRQSGNTESVLVEQLSGSLRGIEIATAEKIVLAYEPVWAIGTGVVATPEQAQDAHSFVRGWIRSKYGDIADNLRILYGGSVKAENAESLLMQRDVDGALIGGASLSSKGFCEIINTAERLQTR